MPLLEGKRMTISLAPKKAGSPKKAETDTAKKENPKKAVETKEKKECVTRRYSALPPFE